jgi:hypothetical protein
MLLLKHNLTRCKYSSVNKQKEEGNIMMKKTIIIAASLVAALAFGDISVDWYSSGYVAEEDGSYNATESLFCQLIWVETYSGDITSTDGTLLNGEVLLDSTYAIYGQFSSDGAEIYTDDTTYTYDYGYIFARIWNTDGTYYYESLVIDCLDYTGVPDTITDAGILAATDFVTTNIEAVPEPATIGLFGLGALSAWFIRRSKKSQEEEV